jgi:hypothetical protein
MHGLALAQMPDADAVITDRLDRGHGYDLNRHEQPLKQACATPFVGLPVPWIIMARLKALLRRSHLAANLTTFER